MREVFTTRTWMALLCVGLSVLVTVPFYFIGEPLPGTGRWDLHMPATHDMTGHFEHMRDFYRGLTAGEIYPRWEEDTNRGFGSPTTCFYPPGIYYLTSALYPVLRDWIRVLLGVHLLLMIASAAAVYWCARQVMTRGAAMVAMMAYIVLPYHLADQYQRGALAELLGFVWMPLILGFSERLFQPQRSGRLLNVAGLAASYGAFLWSHPPTAYQFTLALGLCLPLAALLRGNWRGLLWVSLGLALGLGLSAAYLYPAAAEQDFIRHDVIGRIWPYHDTYLFARPQYTWEHPQFFDLLDVTWLFGTGMIVLSAAALLAIPPRRLQKSVVFWAALGLFASFMMTRASAPLGRLIPEITIGLFTWRMLAITTLAGALLAGAAAEAAQDAWRERRSTKLALFGQLAGLSVAGGAALSILMVAAPVLDAEAFHPMPEHLNYVTLPRTAPADPEQLPRRDRATLDGGAGQAAIEEWKPEHRVIRVRTDQSNMLQVRTFSYPGWTAAVDGRPAAILIDLETGGMVLSVPAGEHVLTLDFRNTRARRAGVRISLLAALLMLATALAGLIAARAPGPRPRTVPATAVR